MESEEDKYPTYSLHALLFIRDKGGDVSIAFALCLSLSVLL